MVLEELLDELRRIAAQLGLTLEELLVSVVSQLSSDHGVQVVIGHFVEKLVEAELKKAAHLLTYKRANEKTEKGDFHVTFLTHPNIVLVIEAKTGQWKGTYTRAFDRKKNPNGSVSVGVCKSRLTGIAKLYERKRFHAVVTGFRVNGSWCVRACLTNDMPSHRKHPEMLGERQTFSLDTPDSKWRDLVTILQDALAQELTFTRRAARWLSLAS